jgi:hypothetical protein
MAGAGEISYPKLDATLLASAMRGLMALIIVAGAVWLLQGLINRWLPGKTIPAAEIGAKMPAEPR